MPKALKGTYAAEYAAAKARDAARRKQARDGIGSGVGTLLGGMVGSVAGPIGAAVGSQIGGNLGGGAEKGLTHMITDPAQAAPPAHSEEGDDAAPSHRFSNMAAPPSETDAHAAWMTSEDAMPRSAQGYCQFFGFKPRLQTGRGFSRFFCS